jgi:WD40 repeat protein
MVAMKDIRPVIVPSDTKGGWTYTIYTDANERPAVFFAADGKRLRAVKILFDDRRVCDWDLSTSKMLRRFELPKNIKIAGIREPEGRFAICYEDNKERGTSEKKQDHAMQVFDFDTGKSGIEVAVPPCDKILWINDHEAFAFFPSIEYGKSESLYHFDYRNGIVSALAIPWGNRSAFLGDCELAEDGRLFFLPGCDDRGRKQLITAVYDPATKKMENHASEKDEMYHLHKSCLVPGGKYFCLYDPEFRIFDRQTFKEITTISLLRTEILAHSFSNDGRYLALFTGMRNDPTTPCIVRIHEVQTGKTVLAFQASTSWAQIKFSPDNRQLAVVSSNGTIEVWPLPDLAGTRN